MEIKDRNSFRLTRFIIFRISAIFKFFALFRSSKKRLLIIKTDAIGDFVLFHNFIEILKRSEKYGEYEVDLLGNVLCRDVALTYDATFISEFFFTRQYALYELPWETLKLGWKLFKRKYEVILQPSSTRLLITDGLAALTAAPIIVGFISDTEGIQQKYKLRTDKFYSQLLPLPPEIYFEFDRNRYFFEQVLDEKLTINGPHIQTKERHRNGIVIFPGAGSVKRGWEKEKFLDLTERILAKTSQPIYITGGTGETAIAKYLVDHLPGTDIINLTAKTSLPELIEIIGSANLLISNETSAIHIAAATKTPAVCILGGGHFERFAPYPTHMDYGPLCVYERMNCFNCNWNCIYQTPENAPNPCVSIITLEQVWNAVELMIN